MTDPVLIGLSLSKLFEGLSLDQLESIARMGRTATIEPGEPLVQEGQANDELFVIIRGEVEVFLPKKRQRLTPVRLAKMGPGGCIGEYSFVDKAPTSASVTASEQTEVFRISQADFERALESDSLVGRIVYRNLLRLLVTRLREDNLEMDVVRFLPLRIDSGRRSK